tara:strand:+ start:1938 stop:2546 length:609 start_codon:yes stop_codon:yes gene_type:complete
VYFVPQLLDAGISGNHMGTPQGVWRRSIECAQSIQAGKNLLNLDTWPSWNSSAQRVLSSSPGLFSEGQRFDLHRIERQRLVEELWLVKSIRKGQSPHFVEVEFEWLGQQRDGKIIGTSLKKLQMTVTILCEDKGGIEIAAWWQTPWWTRPIRARVNAQAKSFATQWLDDLSGKGTAIFEDSQSFSFNVDEGEHSKTVGDDEE